MQNALLNETFELMLKYFAIHSPSIGFPELAYPSLVRVCCTCLSCSNNYVAKQLYSYERCARQLHSLG